MRANLNRNSLGASESLPPIFKRWSMSAIMLAVISCTLPSAAEKETAELTPEDYFSLGHLYAVALSPSGHFACYNEMRWNKDLDKRNNDLWLIDTQTRETRRLTFSAASDKNPTFTPDDKYVFYLTNNQGDKDATPYAGAAQVWRINLQTGKHLQVTRVKDGVTAYELSSDGNSLYYSVSTETRDDPWKKLKKEYELTYGHGIVDHHQIWKLDLRSWRTEKIIDEKRSINFFSVSPDEQYIAMQTTPSPQLIDNEGWSRIDLFHVVSKDVSQVPDQLWRKNVPSPYGWIGHVQWAPDSAAIAFDVTWDGYPSELYGAELEGDAIAVQKIARPDRVDNEGLFRWVPGTRDLLFLGQSRARQHVYRVPDIRNGAHGQITVQTPGDVVIASFGVASSARIAVIKSEPDQLRDLFLVDIKGEQPVYDRLTDLHAHAADWNFPEVSVVSWKGANGDVVEGVLELPKSYDKSKPLPLHVVIHGGPTSASLYRRQFWIYGRSLFASRGWAVFMPNYRGSTGFGKTFMTDLIGRENDIEVEDIVKGVEWLINEGVADPERIGVSGWSNGGYLTSCLISKESLPFEIKAASKGAGVIDMMMQWGQEDTPGHVINYMQGHPWERHEAYRKASPSYFVNNITTPTLIHVGENDPRTPATHSKTLYRALRHYLDVPTELLIYPGEAHGLTKYSHRKAKMEWDLAWFEKYVLDKEPEDDEESD